MILPRNHIALHISKCLHRHSLSVLAAREGREEEAARGGDVPKAALMGCDVPTVHSEWVRGKAPSPGIFLQCPGNFVRYRNSHFKCYCTAGSCENSHYLPTQGLCSSLCLEYSSIENDDFFLIIHILAQMSPPQRGLPSLPFLGGKPSLSHPLLYNPHRT